MKVANSPKGWLYRITLASRIIYFTNYQRNTSQWPCNNFFLPKQKTFKIILIHSLNNCNTGIQPLSQSYDIPIQWIKIDNREKYGRPMKIFIMHEEKTLIAIQQKSCLQLVKDRKETDKKENSGFAKVVGIQVNECLVFLLPFEQHILKQFGDYFSLLRKILDITAVVPRPGRPLL